MLGQDCRRCCFGGPSAGNTLAVAGVDVDVDIDVVDDADVVGDAAAAAVVGNAAAVADNDY